MVKMHTTSPNTDAEETSARLQRLRDQAFTGQDETPPWQRGTIATDVWLSATAEPVVIRTAEVVARCLETIPPAILPDDRFVGCVFRRLRVHQGVSDPDGWRTPAAHPERFGYDPQWPLPVEVRTVYERWLDNKPPVSWRNETREAHTWLNRYGIANPHGLVSGHTLPDHGNLVDEGLAALRTRLASARPAAKTESARAQFAAMDRLLQALQTHVRRCADSARTQSECAESPARRTELLAMADDCEWLADHPPRTFAQALQLLVFSNWADILENRGDASSFGRLDQILFPLYQADQAAGRIGREEGLWLIGAFLVKTWAFQTSRNLCVGGLRPDGADGTNEVSFLFLEAIEALRLSSDLSVRLHTGSPDAFISQAARVIRLGLGRGGIYNDDVTIEALVRKGVALEDARDYAPLGCVEVMIPGRTSYRTMGFDLNLSKVLELVLNRGECLVSGDRVWSDVPDDFATFDELLTAYRARVRAVVEAGTAIIHEDEHTECRWAPRPWLTVLSRGGITDGRDLTEGQPRYNPVGVTLMGVADIANSLVAVERLVFQERLVDIPGLRTILRDNWEGNETLHQRVINRLPRFGQETPDANRIGAAESNFFADCFEDKRTFYGDRFWPMIFGVSTGVIYGLGPKTGATPGGRRLGETLAHSLQPSPAGPRGGLTDILAACTEIDLHKFPGGISNVQECDPVLIGGEGGTTRLETVLRGYCRMGGMELSLNFLSEADLLDAQANPERYPHLMVRLFGLSVRFVALSRELQASVIERARAATRGGAAIGSNAA